MLLSTKLENGETIGLIFKSFSMLLKKGKEKKASPLA